MKCIGGSFHVSGIAKLHGSEDKSLFMQRVQTIKLKPIFAHIIEPENVSIQRQ
jgi:hypothetical protein